jgi:RecJ-like exonuclease
MNIQDNLKRLVGGYLFGLSFVSDKMTNTAKKGMEVLHATACKITPIVFSYNAIEGLEKTRDNIAIKLTQYAYCTRCEGKGYLNVMSLTGDFVGKEPCPQCTKRGYQRKIGIKEDKDNTGRLNPSTLQKEAAMKVFDKIMKRTRDEKSLEPIYCSTCKGQRFIHARDYMGKYLGQKRCLACYGTGKDYQAMSSAILEKCVKTHIAKGYSETMARAFCEASCFKGMQE